MLAAMSEAVHLSFTSVEDRVHLGSLRCHPDLTTSGPDEHHMSNQLPTPTNGVGSVNTSKRRIFAGAIALTLVAAACGSDDDSGSDTTDAVETTDEMTEDSTHSTDDMTETTDDMDAGDLSGSLLVSGSSTVEPISVAVGDAFADANPAVAITVNGPGTGDGFAQFCAGETDISDASRAIKAEEAETCAANGIDFIELKVAVDGLSVITSAENSDLECLSFVDLYALLGPDATGVNNWSGATEMADEFAATVTDFGAVHTPYPAQYQAILTAFGLLSADSNDVTVYVRNDVYDFVRMNGKAIKPKPGAGVQWQRPFPRNITILVRDLEAAS
jgi:hypothetical protein